MDRKQSLLQFYKRCVEKGYTDMNSEDQRLDAKVVAADFQIKYKDISELFEEAKAVAVQANAEAERKQVDGQLLVSIKGNENNLKVFLRPDESVYSVLDAGDKIEGAPKITVNKGGTLSYTYNPSKAIYTGATVGGITTGGVEYTKASYSEKVVDTGKGYIDVSLGGKTFTAHIISFSPFIRERFKRNDSFQRLAGKSGSISCRKSSSYANSLLAKSLSGADYKQQMTVLSQIADDERLPYSQCVEIANLLGRMVSKDFPPLDEDVYSRAVALLKSSDSMQLNHAEKLLLSILGYKDVADLIYTRAVDLSVSNASSELTRAIELFNSISDYKDSKSRVSDLKVKIETVIHEEKKKALLRKAARAKHGKKIAVIGSIAVVAIVIVSIVFSKAIMPVIHYKNAEELLTAGDYLGALAQFDAAGEYQDARERSLDLWDDVGRRMSLATGSYYTVGLRFDGAVVATGSNKYGQCNVSSWTDIVAIAAGYSHTVGLKSDGTVVAIGDNEDGECDVSDWTDIVAVAVSYFRTVGLKSDGTVVAIGDSEDGECDVSNWTDIVAIAAGGSHTVGLKSDGTVVATGSNKYGQCNVSRWADIVVVVASNFHTVGLKSDGTVVVAGYDSYGQCDVGSWTDIVAVAADGEHTVGLKSDGTVVATGLNKYGQCNVSQWTDIVAIAAGDSHTVGLKSDGTVVAVGYDFYGQCDVSGWTDIKRPNQ